MKFNQTYLAIERIWREKFENQLPNKREEEYVSSRMNNLKTFFQNKQYLEAIGTTKALFGYFYRIWASKNNRLSQHALVMADQLWNLEGIIDKTKKV